VLSRAPPLTTWEAPLPGSDSALSSGMGSSAFTASSVALIAEDAVGSDLERSLSFTVASSAVAV
jgi:hypothetical protein